MEEPEDEPAAAEASGVSGMPLREWERVRGVSGPVSARVSCVATGRDARDAAEEEPTGGRGNFRMLTIHSLLVAGPRSGFSVT